MQASSWSKHDLCGTVVLEMWRHFESPFCIEFCLKDSARSRQEHFRLSCSRKWTFLFCVRRFQRVGSSVSCVNSSCPTPVTRIFAMSSSGAVQSVVKLTCSASGVFVIVCEEIGGRTLVGCCGFRPFGLLRLRRECQWKKDVMDH